MALNTLVVQADTSKLDGVLGLVEATGALVNAMTPDDQARYVIELVAVQDAMAALSDSVPEWAPALISVTARETHDGPAA